MLRAASRAPFVAALAVAGAQQSKAAPATTDSAPDPNATTERIRAVIAAVCTADEPATTVLTTALGGAVELSREPLRMRGRERGTRLSSIMRRRPARAS